VLVEVALHLLEMTDTNAIALLKDANKERCVLIEGRNAVAWTEGRS
jgi:hypothetical protein